MKRARWIKVSDLTRKRFGASVALVVGAAVALSGSVATAGEISYDPAFDSAYVWRGLTFTDGAVLQPALTASYDNGFSVNVWGNIDVDDTNNLAGEFQEVDLTLSYALVRESAWNVEVGVIEYLFPNGVGPETRELYLTLSGDVAVSPSLSVYYDVDEVEDFYANFSLGWSDEISGALSYDLALSVGFAGEDFSRFYGGTDSGFFDGIAQLNLNFKPSERLTISPFVAFVENLDSAALVNQPVDFHGGVVLSVSFE